MSAASHHILLTPAEAETLRLMADENLSNPELAEHLCVSEAAIKSRLHRLYERTQLDGRTAAVSFALRHWGCCVAKATS